MDGRARMILPYDSGRFLNGQTASCSDLTGGDVRTVAGVTGSLSAAAASESIDSPAVRGENDRRPTYWGIWTLPDKRGIQLI
jgi:hypothetical protein